MESFASPSRAASVDPATSANGNAKRAAVENEEWEASITFARSKKSTAITADQTVLEAAEALGVAINYDCRAGICGQCKVKRLAGEVIMEADEALTSADRANDMILSCQARCLDQVVVVA